MSTLWLATGLAVVVTGVATGVRLHFRKTRTFAPFVPTSHEEVRLALEAVALGFEDTLYDLGCGDGRVLVHARARGARALGVEQSRLLHAAARFRVWRNGGGGIQVFKGDLFDVDLSPATVIFIFPAPKTAGGRLLDKIEKECRPGTMVISHAFPFPDREPEKIIAVPNPASWPLYIYRVAERPHFHLSPSHQERSGERKRLLAGGS